MTNSEKYQNLRANVTYSHVSSVNACVEFTNWCVLNYIISLFDQGIWYTRVPYDQTKYTTEELFLIWLDSNYEK